MRSSHLSVGQRPLTRVAALSLLSLTSYAHADALPFVDYYKTNLASNTTIDSNAAIRLLSGYSSLWTTGATWNTGTPTDIGNTVMGASQAYAIKVTTNRTAAQEASAYLIDRRNQSYSAIDGLGTLADAYRTAAGATTTIINVAADAGIAKYDDKGTGGGLTSSATVGAIVGLVGTVRGNYSSSNPAKSYFNSPRPWRLTDDNHVVALGTETTGYYTTTLSDGTPNYAGTVTNFPDYDSNVVIVPTLLAVRSSTPESDGGYVSGHTNAGYLASIAMAYAIPIRFQNLLLNASALGENRILAGMHSPLDVIGGRMLATALAAGILSDAANATLKVNAYEQGKAFVATNDVVSTNRFEGADFHDLVAHQIEKRRFTFRMTYNLPVTGNTNIAAVVPKGAEVLLETRLPYLSGEQRREVLRSTAIPSGRAVLDDVEGWGRLNLYAAADGYGAFKNDVTVNMDAGLGGFAARDLWRNDIGGTGRLVKQGSGELVLTGDNSYRGGTQIEYGAIVAASSNALGHGGVTVIDGTLVDYAPLLLNVGGDYAQSHSATLEMIVGNGVDHLPRGLMRVRGNGRLGGHLRVTFTQAPRGKTLSFPLLSFKGNRKGEFNDVVVTGANGYTYSVSYGRDCVTLNLRRRPNRS